MNKVILIGYLAKDVELRYTQNNTPVATFTIAVNRRATEKNQNPGADFINCTAWKGQALNLSKYCQKGSQIAIEGRLLVDNYTDNIGNKRYVTKVIAESITFVGYKKETQEVATDYQVSDTATPVATDPFAEFGEEVTLSEDDLPF